MTHLGSKTTLTFSGYVLYERAEQTHHHRDSKTQEQPDTPPPVCTHTELCVCELLAGYYRGQANPAPAFRAVKQLEAHKLLTS